MREADEFAVAHRAGDCCCRYASLTHFICARNRFDVEHVKQALSLALALHELATNAAKYGALSVPNGTINVTWDCPSTTQGQVLRFAWRETGGPVVAPPTRKGFGSRLIEKTLSSDFGGNVKVDFDPKGVICGFETQLSNLAPGFEQP